MSTATMTFTGRLLPSPLTGFVGRQEEIKSIAALVQDPETRLLTLTGPGGIGKTRLAIEVARQLEPALAKPATFVPLAPLHSHEDVLPTIADRLELWDARSEGLIERIAALLHDEPALVLLDNFEHVSPASPLVGELLAHCPGLTIMATSRIPLHVQGEREYAVPQLGLVDRSGATSVEDLASNESVQLFVQRAQAVKQDFSLDESNLRMVAEICEKLEGLPLAIELAAARTKVLPVQALCDRLENQLQLLRSDARDLPPRLRTMASAIAWSYDLLDPEERRLFRLLSIFTAVFTLEDAAALAGIDELDALDAISSLVDKSLLSPRATSGTQPVYRMLQVMRQFGQEQLEREGELESARNQHTGYFAKMAESAYEAYFGSGQAEAVAHLEHYHDDLRAALTWALETRNLETAAAFGKSLWVFWHLRCHLGEGRRWLERLLAEQRHLPGEALPTILFGAGILAISQRDFDEVRALANRLAEISTRTDDPLVHGYTLYLAGSSIGHERPEAREYYSRAAEVWQALDNEHWMWYALSQVALSSMESGDLDATLEHTREVYELCRRLNHSWAISLTGGYLGRVYRHLNRQDEALTHFHEALTLASRTGDRILTPTILEHIAGLAALGGSAEAAARLFGHAALVRETRSFPTKPIDVEIHDRAIAEARNRLGDDSFRSAWAAGRRMSLDLAVSEALGISLDRKDESVPQPSDRSLLTRREREVLRHIVRGSTDQEIADDLYVSYRTVTTHVTNILNKLGVHSRTEAAAVAVRKGLVPD